MGLKKNIRLIIQVFFFVFILLIVANHQLEEVDMSIPFVPSLSLHAICPFGGVETGFSLITAGLYIPKLHQSTVVIFSLVILTSILFGPMLCSYVCPLGSIQEWVGKIGRKLFGSRYNRFIPKKADQMLRYLRYFSLIAVVYFTAKSLTLAFLVVDPYYALFNFYTGEVAVTAIAVLTLTVLASLFVERPWCKFACPYGAMLGLTNLFRVFSIKRNTTTCNACKTCDDVCPMNIQVSDQTIIRDHQCISCHTCLSEHSCPVEDTVTISPSYTRRLK